MRGRPSGSVRHTLSISYKCLKWENTMCSVDTKISTALIAIRKITVNSY